MVRASVKASQAKARATRARKAAEAEPAAVDPVARVLVDVPLAHLDRSFDYSVPVAMADTAVPGARVKVRFAGQDVDGYVLDRGAESDHTGRLDAAAPGGQPRAGAAPADRGPGRRARRAVRRHPLRRAAAGRPAAPRDHREGAVAACRAVAPRRRRGRGGLGRPPSPARRSCATSPTGGSPRAVWSAAPATDWPALVAHAAAATLASGRGVVICVPDGKDVARVDRALLGDPGRGPARHAHRRRRPGPALPRLPRRQPRRPAGRRRHPRRRLRAGPRPRPRRHLGRRRRPARRAARAVPPHPRDAAAARRARGRRRADRRLRAHRRGGVPAPHRLGPGDRRGPRGGTPAGDRADRRRAETDRDVHARGARIPREVHLAVRDALETGPVLVQTPRLGYVNVLACERCRTPARCQACQGPLALTGPTTPPACRWCGTVDEAWACARVRPPRPAGAGARRRPHRRGARPRAAQHPGAHQLRRHRAGRRSRRAKQVVVATPGAEPVAEGGYAAVVLLDTWLLLSPDRPARRRGGAAPLGRRGRAGAARRPGRRGRRPRAPDAAGAGALGPGRLRRARDRRTARGPPAAGQPAGDDHRRARAPSTTRSPCSPPRRPPRCWARSTWPRAESRVVVRVPRAEGADLSRALGELQRLRSARKLDAVRIQVDPPTL